VTDDAAEDRPYRVLARAETALIAYADAPTPALATAAQQALLDMDRAARDGRALSWSPDRVANTIDELKRQRGRLGPRSQGRSAISTAVGVIGGLVVGAHSSRWPDQAVRYCVAWAAVYLAAHLYEHGGVVPPALLKDLDEAIGTLEGLWERLPRRDG